MAHDPDFLAGLAEAGISDWAPAPHGNSNATKGGLQVVFRLDQKWEANLDTSDIVTDYGDGYTVIEGDCAPTAGGALANLKARLTRARDQLDAALKMLEPNP